MRTPRPTALLTGLAILTTACAASSPADNGADRTFLARMTPHHERAIAVARIGETHAADPRVRAFARRIVREQTPELDALRHAARGQRIDTARGAAQAVHRIDDAQVRALGARRGRAFDRQFLTLNVTSEQGAYTMARTELAHGAASAPRKIARSIADSPSEIRELQALLRTLPA